jgi:hypothetical protein
MAVVSGRRTGRLVGTPFEPGSPVNRSASLTVRKAAA